MPLATTSPHHPRDPGQATTLWELWGQTGWPWLCGGRRGWRCPNFPGPPSRPAQGSAGLLPAPGKCRSPLGMPLEMPSASSRRFCPPGCRWGRFEPCEKSSVPKKIRSLAAAEWGRPHHPRPLLSPLPLPHPSGSGPARLQCPLSLGVWPQINLGGSKGARGVGAEVPGGRSPSSV